MNDVVKQNNYFRQHISNRDTKQKKNSNNPDDMIPDALFNGVTLVVLEVSIQFL